MQSDEPSLADGGIEPRPAGGGSQSDRGQSSVETGSAAEAAGSNLETPQEARRSITRWLVGMAAFVLAAAIGGGLLFEVPYVALVPGSARDTEPLIEVEGIDDYPSEGELLYTTVRLRQRPNFWEYLLLRVDDDAEVVPEEDILGDRSPEENRELNLNLMTDSKQVAVAVALEQLGYDAVQADAVLIHDVVADEPADGILERGDSVLAIDGSATTSTDALVSTLGDLQPGDTIELEVQRFGAGTTEVVSVVLSEHPDKPGSAFLGVQPGDRLTFTDDFGFSVEIDSGSVGGPSAGLAFTLAVLDQLTEGELTGGASVAVTGTINAAGQVGPVGGVPQKTAAVRELGVDAFIVPQDLGAEELAAIEEKADGKLEIIPVATVEEALAALAALGGDVDAVGEFAAANQTSG